MDTTNKIEITGADLAAIVKAAYSLSRPQGMGFLHFTPGDMSDERAAEIVNFQRRDPRIPLSLDYIEGRAVKLTVWRDTEDRLWIANDWYDHTDEDLQQLLKAIGKEQAAA
ncbi:MAG: hypothetical protein J0I15_07065 [Herbaspirillum huttiense]|uniref:hypothetical protein n=1 Tax=Herbaspirillum huttiense TaxID=863372 RepID=UPI001AD1137D|nr:hypothetical protein [Herbaspirillum huttiense]MBN9356190.1 hypothetical protein [Herbaspirillum huttiense]